MLRFLDRWVLSQFEFSADAFCVGAALFRRPIGASCDEVDRSAEETLQRVLEPGESVRVSAGLLGPELAEEIRIAHQRRVEVVGRPRAEQVESLLLAAEQEWRDVGDAGGLRDRKRRGAADGEGGEADAGGEHAVQHAFAHLGRDARGHAMPYDLL